MSAELKSGDERGGRGRLAVYASVGPQLVHYDVDVEGAALVKREPVMLPAKVQYAWPHASGQYLYVASSNGGPRSTGDKHYANALRIDPASGALKLHGKPISLASRPIHITTDIPAAHALIAYNNPSGVTVHRINADGTLSEGLKQPGPLDAGIFAHQIRVSASNDTAILVTRGNNAAAGKPEDPGALKLFDYKDGVLTNRASIAPEGGYGYGPRHLDFHPSRPWVYVALERQNKLYVHDLGGDPFKAPLFRKETLANPRDVRPGQMVGTIHVHPSGRFVYVINRAYTPTDFEGKRVLMGGENNIAVYAIDERTGEPTLIENVDTRGVYPRTFAIDPSGRMLVVANLMPMLVRNAATVSTVPASLAVFRIGGDGRLGYVRKYDIDVGGEIMFWMGMVRILSDTAPTKS